MYKPAIIGGCSRSASTPDMTVVIRPHFQNTFMVRFAQGKQEKLYLGNLSSLRDWGYAKDYVECMWLILQHDTPEDFVIATGVQHSVREFATLAFRHAGIELEWQGSDMNEKGIDKATGKVLVRFPDRYIYTHQRMVSQPDLPHRKTPPLLARSFLPLFEDVCQVKFIFPVGDPDPFVLPDG